LTNVDSSLNNNEYQAVFTVSVNSQSVGTATTNAATFNIATAPTVTTQPTNQNVAAGTTATFTAAASGDPTPGVQWYVNANDGSGFTPIGGATSTTLTLTNVSTSQNNYGYEAVFTNLAGTITTSAATLTFKATPTITWANPADITDSTPLSATQLDATANVPGTFVYSPAAGTFLSAGQQQALSVTFTPTDSVDYASASATAYVNVSDGASTALAFAQQPPTTTASNAIFSPAVVVAIRDAAGATVTGDTSTVTLTLSSGTFAGGGTTVTAQAVNGVATFSSLSIANTGNYTLTATDGSLTSAVSNGFSIGASSFVNFNAGATTFTSQFALNNAGTPGGTNFTWGAAYGVDDQTGATAGGGVSSTSQTDQTAIYTPTTFNLSDGQIHTISEFVTAPTVSNGTDRLLQIGFVSASTAGLNGGFSFISARVLGNRSVEAQTGNGTGTSAVSIDNTVATGTINSGDWLQLVFTTQETASGSFEGTFSLFDYGPTGVGAPTTVLAAVPYSVTGLTTLGTASAVYAGFRSDVFETLAPGALAYDNFAVDQPPSVPTVSISPASKTVLSGNSTSFFAAANGNSAQSVQWQVSTNGGATFANLSNGGVYSGDTTMTLSISSTAGLNGNLYRAVFSNSAGTAASTAATLKLTGSGSQTYPSVTTQPANPTIVNAGNNATITAAASGKTTGSGNLTVQWRVSTNGGVSFSNLTNGGAYSWAGTVTSSGNPVSDTLTITDATFSFNGNIYDAIFTNSLGSAPSDPSTLMVETAPVVTTQPSSQTVDIGSLVTFTAAASGNAAPTVQWQSSTNGGGSWNNINGATSATLTFNSVSASQAGNEYRAIFTNSVGTVTTNAATLTLDTNTAVLSAPSSPAPQGAAVTFTAMVAGSPSVGTVSFYLGSVAQGNQFGTAVNISGGTANSTADSSLSPGNDTIIAVYSGGTGFVGSQGTISITIEPGAPTSSVASLPAVENSASFTVNWSGQDYAGGSGIADYNVYVSDDDGAYALFESDTTATSATFTGQDGITYAFYSVATDNVGNQQATPTMAQATTLVDLPATATIVSPGANPLFAPVDQLTVSFSKPITGLVLADLSLTLNGSGNLLTASQTLTTSDGQNYTLGNLASLTDNPGTYLLTLTAAGSGISDTVGTAFATDATVTFVENVPALVTSSADSGDGSLRQALLDAEGAPGLTHTIQFDLAAGAQTIDLLSPLPTLADPIIVDVDATQNVTMVGSSSTAWNNTQSFELSGAGSLTFDGGIDGTGDLVVDAGGSLTANQILENSLVIGAGATVTIAPSGPGIGMVATSAASDVQTTVGAGGTTLAERIAAVAARRARIMALLLASEDSQTPTAVGTTTALADSSLVTAPVASTSIVPAVPAAAPSAALATVPAKPNTSAPAANILTPSVPGNPPPAPTPGKPLSVSHAAAPPPPEVFVLPTAPALPENAPKSPSPATLDSSSPTSLVDAISKDQQGTTAQFEARPLNPQAVDAVLGGDSSSFVEENAVEMLLATIDELDSLEY